MAIVAFLLAALFSFTLWLISLRYRPRFEGRERVVMNWSFDGTPNSYASPRVALSVTPVTGTLSLFLVATLVAFATPPDYWIVAICLIPFTGLVCAGIHAAHLHFAARAATSGDS